MNTLTISAARPADGRLLANPSIDLRRPSFSKPFSSIAFRCPRQTPPSLSFLVPIRASSQNRIGGSPNESTKFRKFQISNKNSTSEVASIPFLGALKTGLATTVAAAAVFFAGFYFSGKPSIAATFTDTPKIRLPAHDSVSDEEKEKFLEEQLLSDPNDLDGLRSLMEIKIRNEKITEAIEVIDKLIELEPEETEWPLMKAHLYAHIKELGIAQDGFIEVMKKDPYRVEAYHGLVIVASQEESGEDLGNVEKMVEEAMKLCKKDNKKDDLRDFMLLFAQIRVIQGRYEEALKVYQDLVKDEPRDFRPYLCQGIIYTLLRKKNEAEKNFEKYRRLVPKEHPYASYFDDNMIATKIFAQKMENEIAMAKS